MQLHRLSIDEFNQTRSNPKRLTEGQPSVEFWSYVEEIPVEDFQGFDCRAGEVTHVYQMDNGLQHVLINSEYQGVAMVIVCDVPNNKIIGHYLLDVNPPGSRRPDEDQ